MIEIAPGWYGQVRWLDEKGGKMIGIVGNGFVGGALLEALKTVGGHKDIYVYDKHKKMGSMQELIYKCNDIFVCVPTPQNKDGSCDTTIVSEVFMEAKKYCEDLSNKLFIVKSTVPPGFCNTLEFMYEVSVSFQPEFLNQKTAVEDMCNMSKIAIGGKNDEIRKRVLALFAWINPNADNVVFTDNITAELAKYVANVQLAGQVAVANALYDICMAYGVNWKPIKDILLFDPLMGKNINVPGPDGKQGFGGACLPKDISSIVYEARRRGVKPYLLEEIIRYNESLRSDL